MDQSIPSNTANTNIYESLKNYKKIEIENKSISVNRVKQLIWLYVILLIFEGALRKWILPGLSTPLLLIRDPVAVWLVIIAWRRGLFSANTYVSLMTLIGFFSIFTAVIVGHGNILVALFGARVLFLHFPLIFIIGRVFDRDDIIKIGKTLLWICIPMTVLLILQFYSPQSALVNRGLGGDAAGSGFDGAQGYYRASGTFSFTSGIVLFYSLAACFIFYFWLSPQKHVNRFLLIVASIALVIAIPASISRSLFFSIIVTIIFIVIAISRNPRYLGKVILAGLTIVVVFIGLSNLSVFQTTTEVFTARLTTANESEGGLNGVIGGRYLGGMIEPFFAALDYPFFGYGIGLGTNVGSVLLTGKANFLIAEGEWGRLLGEMGYILGTSVILIRLVLSFKIARASFKRLSSGDTLPWILLSFCLLILPQGQWSQPTSLGFCIIAAGFNIAAMNTAKPINTKQRPRYSANKETNLSAI